MPVISTNTAANSAVRYLNVNAADQSSSLSKIASGSRITKASDDAAGLAISTRINSDVVALEQAATNASHAMSMLQTADGGAARISDILMRMKALVTQSASATVTDTERAYIGAEYDALVLEIGSVATGTRYNGQSLLTGSFTAADVFVGSDAADVIELSFTDIDAAALGVAAAGATTQAAAETAIAGVTTAISTVSAARANIGALQSRFDFQSETIATSIENLDAASSAIADVDIAAEQAKLSSSEVKVQAAVAAAASANSMPQALLKLLG
ncbi:flagellin [Blastochloris sulfoviridis]|uniref:Flagellin n=1 Tax=Blastochloris sulfoviridis TaxID=50712 RepID=A0A5M6I2X2_9HYPH|nr:flagellin [Blastochloris sulfoviridis]KAA5602561.1 flagellin [Blastochloris sulfoviridis]